MDTLDDLKQAVLEGKSAASVQATQQLLGEGVTPAAIFQQGLFPAMEIVGQKMHNGEFYIPEVLLASKAMRAATLILKPLLSTPGQDQVQSKGKIVAGTVQGDMHDIGKSLVVMMLEGAGFQVIDLGVDVSPERFLTTVQENGAGAVALSALLTTTMLNMRKVVEALENAGQRGKVKVMIGGAPVTQRFATEIGADGYSRDAFGAVELATGWLGRE